MVTTGKRDNIDFITFSVEKINALNADEIREKIIKFLNLQIQNY